MYIEKLWPRNIYSCWDMKQKLYTVISSWLWVNRNMNDKWGWNDNPYAIQLHFDNIFLWKIKHLSIKKANFVSEGRGVQSTSRVHQW